jgi:hypothetical protein
LRDICLSEKDETTIIPSKTFSKTSLHAKTATHIENHSASNIKEPPQLTHFEDDCSGLDH